MFIVSLTKLSRYFYSMADCFMWMFAITFGLAAACSFNCRLTEDEDRRPRGFEGSSSLQARFQRKADFSALAIPAALLKLQGFNRTIAKNNAESYPVGGLDGIYCRSCVPVFNIYLILSVVFTLLIILFLVYEAAVYLRFLEGWKNEAR